MKPVYFADKICDLYVYVLNRALKFVCEQLPELVEHKENVTRFEFYHEPYNCKQYWLEYKDTKIVDWKMKVCGTHIFADEMKFYVTREELQKLIKTT